MPHSLASEVMLSGEKPLVPVCQAAQLWHECMLLPFIVVSLVVWVWSFETGSHYMDMADLELDI